MFTSLGFISSKGRQNSGSRRLDSMGLARIAKHPLPILMCRINKPRKKTSLTPLIVTAVRFSSNSCSYRQFSRIFKIKNDFD